MKRLIGSVLLGVGILIAGASGLCSLGFLIFMFASALSAQGGGGAFIILPMILASGGIPFAIGFGLYKWGQSLIREADTADKSAP